MSKRPPTRDLDSLHITQNPPGAQKEKVRQRAVPLSCEYDHLPFVHEQFGGTYVEEPEPVEPKRPRARRSRRPYAELRAASAFSFLDGASLPEDLIHHAAERGLPAMALVDTNGVYGAPRFYTAARKAGIRALVGAELVMAPADGSEMPRDRAGKPVHGDRLTVLVENRAGYRNLCKLITAGALNHPKGQARFSWDLVEQYAVGLHCLTRADEATIRRISGIFPGRTHLELQRHQLREEEHRNQMLVSLAA
ncbi:MAG TPA: PHP domain-containing protein, partial [Thermoanaerobaculia bacterium]|nr:PHP domain-containing protein [Thermoanaerobaculia bacterium]